MRTARQLGVVIVEFAVTAVVLLTLIGIIWSLLSIEDFRQSIYAAAFSAFNNKQNMLFTRDAAGNTARWDVTNINPGLLDDVRTEFQTRVTSGSGYTSSALTVLCDVRLAYLTLSSGIVTATAPDLIPPASAPPGDAALLEGLMSTESTNYATRMQNRYLLPREALLNTDPEYQSGYISSGSAIDPATATGIRDIYLDSSPFFTWACLIRRGVLSYNIDRQFSGVFIPNKTIL